MSKYLAKINLETKVLTLQLNKKEIKTPIFDKSECNSEFLTVPARCESFHYIKINTCSKEDSVVYAEDLGNNLFLAGAIVKANVDKIPVKILNVSEKDIRIPIFTPILKPLIFIRLLSM